MNGVEKFDDGVKKFKISVELRVTKLCSDAIGFSAGAFRFFANLGRMVEMASIMPFKPSEISFTSRDLCVLLKALASYTLIQLAQSCTQALLLIRFHKYQQRYK